MVTPVRAASITALFLCAFSDDLSNALDRDPRAALGVMLHCDGSKLQLINRPLVFHTPPGEYTMLQPSPADPHYSPAPRSESLRSARTAAGLIAPAKHAHNPARQDKDWARRHVPDQGSSRTILESVMTRE